jgi:hypothetical protein
MPLLVHQLETLYSQMWREYENGELPAPDLTSLDAYLEVGSKVNHEELEVQLVKDYREWWQRMLARRHRFRPVAPDRRLATLGSIE